MLLQLNRVYDVRAAELISRRRATLMDMSAGFAMAIREGLCKYVIRGVIAELEGYADEALGFEERAMIFYAYPELDAHAFEHDSFRAGLSKLKCDMLCLRQDRALASYEFSVELNSLLADWISDHMKRDDDELMRFLLSN